MSAILELALHHFETYINGFLEPESLNFYPNHALQSSVEAEIIIFLPKKVAILCVFCQNIIDGKDPEAPHTKNCAFIRYVW